MSGADPDPEADVAAQAAASREVARAAARIRRWREQHPDATVLVEHLGGRARLVLTASGHDFGDVVLRSVAAAEQACREADVTPGSWDRATAGEVQLTPARRTRMAGTGR